MALESQAPAQTRLVRVLAGPAGGVGQEFRSPVHIMFKAELTNGSKPNKCEISLYNLSYQSVSQIERSGTTVQLLVGEGAAGRIFAGDIDRRGILTRIEPPNRITTIKCADGRRIWRSVRFVRSYGAGATRKAILADVIAATGLPLGYLSPLLRDHIFATGWAFAGKARDALAQILRIDGARYSIQSGALQILAPGETQPGNSPLITPNTGLKKSPTRTKKGISITTVLDPRIRPGRGFQVLSTGVSGDFKCVKASHTGDSRGIRWETTAQGIALRA
jgi:hypothetical protein